MKITSEKRAAAARANGARSRGPRTIAGKSRSSRNAITHGLLSKSIVLQDDDPQLYTALTKSYCARLQPRDAAELALVHQLAATSWRLRRLQNFERRSPAGASNGLGPTPLDRHFAKLTKAYSRLLNKLLHRGDLRLPQKKVDQTNRKPPAFATKTARNEPIIEATTNPFFRRFA